MRLAFVLLLAFTLGLAACGGDDNDEEGVIESGDQDIQDGADGTADGVGQVVTTESGLHIIDIEVGTGETAEAGDAVSVHYTGTLEDGSKFDSSLDRGQPFQFRLGEGQVIAGWDEGVAGMKVGGKRRLIIPPELAYGEQGFGDVIPPNAELTFEIELLDVE